MKLSFNLCESILFVLLGFISCRANAYVLLGTKKIVVGGARAGDGNGIPLEKARVTLNAAFEVNDYHSYSYRSLLTDSTGNFEFPQLGGGEYSISVFATGFRTRVIRHNFENYSENLNIRLDKDDD